MNPAGRAREHVATDYPAFHSGSRHVLLSRKQSVDDEDTVSSGIPSSCLSFPVVHTILDHMLADIRKLDATLAIKAQPLQLA